MEHQEEKNKPKQPAAAFSIPDTAAYLNVSVNTVRKLIEQGHLRAVRVSERAVRILRKDVDAHMSTGVK